MSARQLALIPLREPGASEIRAIVDDRMRDWKLHQEAREARRLERRENREMARHDALIATLRSLCDRGHLLIDVDEEGECRFQLPGG